MSKRIAVIGAGAVGGYAGAHMTAAGHDVTLIDPWPEHVEQMKAHGLEILRHDPAGAAEREGQCHAPDRGAEPGEAAADRHRLRCGQVVRHGLGDDADPAVPVGLGLRGLDAELHQRGARRRRRRLGPHARLHRDRWRRRRSVPARPYPPRLRETCRYHLVLCRRTQRQDHPARTGDRRYPVQRRCIEGHRQSVGRALDQTVRQRHAQRCLRRDRHGRQCARQPPGGPPHLHPVGRRSRSASAKSWATNWEKSVRCRSRRWRRRWKAMRRPTPRSNA